MMSIRRAALVIALGALIGAVAPMADPSPPSAQANAACDIGLGPADAVTGALGFGTPASDGCNYVTDPVLGAAEDAVVDPLKDAVTDLGKGVFKKVTGWVAEGAVWLIAEVAVLSDKTTRPDLLSKGFVRQYRLMASIAAFMAALMLIFAVFEALGRGDAAMLGRVFLINTPLAAIATTAAYVVVQLLVATCDGMCAAITQSTGGDAEEFFKGTMEAIATLGGTGGAALAGPAGEVTAGVAVPMFVGLIAVAIAAFAAFFVWIELLMRDAAIYIVALFMPFALGASIWPRWSSALRRTCELLVVVIFSKFVIVAIIALAASLLAQNDGSVEHVLAATVMLLLACFSPFVLFKLVPFAEGAMSAAYGRQSASSGSIRAVQSANSVMTIQRMGRANWASAESGGASGAKAPANGKSPAAPSGGAAAASGGAAATGAVGIVYGAAMGAAKAGTGAAERMASGGVGEAGGTAGSSAPGDGVAGSAGAESAPRPPRAEASSGAGGTGQPRGQKTQTARQANPPSAPAAEPSEASGGSSSPGDARPARPAVDKQASSGRPGST